MVANVWTVSHSQPLIGSRSRRMISRRRSSATGGLSVSTICKYDNMHYVKYRLSGDQNQPSPFHAPALQGRQVVHAKDVEVIVVGDLQPDVVPHDPAYAEFVGAPARHAYNAVARSDELISSR